MFKIMFINFYVFFLKGLGLGKPKFLPGKNLRFCGFRWIFFQPSGGQGAGGYQKDLVCNGLCQETASMGESLVNYDPENKPIYIVEIFHPLSGSMLIYIIYWSICIYI